MTAEPQRTHQYLIALGSNLGDRGRHLFLARKALGQRAGKILALSQDVETAPLGAADQPFLNAALLLASDLEPEPLLKVLLAIETEQGRIRKEKWGNRTLDLDIILWKPKDSLSDALPAVFRSEKLTIPHPEMLNRLFVLEPAVQVAAHWRHPETGKTLMESLATLRAELSHGL